MRLPRVRFRVGTLLFAVAVVAANCWAFRRICEVPIYSFGKVTYCILPAAVGALPLVNVAVIGTLLFAASRIRSFSQGHATNPRPSVSGVTYFSLHFLMLGCLVSLFMPDAVESQRGLLD